MQIHELNDFQGIPGAGDFLAVDNSFDTTKISAENFLKYKANVPLDGEGNPDTGNDGQILRSKGNGSTEWSDVGLPTDEQTETAVSKWLDDHPEATTTVDYKITAKVFNNVAQMIADLTLVDDSKVLTMGFYTVGDGGGAEYYIRAIGADVADGATIIALDNGLAAELIINDAVVNIKQLGAKPQDGSRHDIAPFLAIFESKLRNKAKLYIPMGLWNCSGYLFTHPVNVFGDYNFSKGSNGGMYTTIIAPYNASQTYVIKISDISAGIVPTFTFTDVVLSSAFFTISGDNYTYSSYATISDGVLVMDGAEFGTIDNLMFLYTNCRSLVFRGCCEILIKNLNIRIKDNNSKPAIFFEKNSQRVVNSSLIFETIQVEGIFGSVMEFRNYVTNCELGNIMFEQGTPVTGSNRTMCYSNDYDDSAVTRMGFFNIISGAYVEGIKVGSINADGFSSYSVEENGTPIIFDSIFTGSSSYPIFVNIDSITLANVCKKFYLFSDGTSDTGTGKFGGSVSFVDFGQLVYSTGSLLDAEQIYPDMRAALVPKYKISRKNDGSRYLFANELFHQSGYADNIERALYGNNAYSLGLSNTLTPEHCAIAAMAGAGSDTARAVGRFIFDKKINSISFRTTSVKSAGATITFVQNGTVKATLDVTNQEAIGVWSWHTIDAANLSSLDEGPVDIRFVVGGYNRGAIDCCLIQ